MGWLSTTSFTTVRAMTQHSPPSQRSTLKRGAANAVYDPAQIRSILKAGMLAHVGVTTPDGPIVLPMVYGLDDESIYLHGSVANAMLRSGKDQDVCVSVTLLDGLVIARTPLHNSMNYRSVVIRGTARRVEDPAEKVRTLRIINDHIVANWDTARPPSESDLRQTMVLAVGLSDAAAKVRTGDPRDEPEDVQGPWWAGVIALRTVAGQPTASADLASGIAVPDAIGGFELP